MQVQRYRWSTECALRPNRRRLCPCRCSGGLATLSSGSSRRRRPWRSAPSARPPPSAPQVALHPSAPAHCTAAERTRSVSGCINLGRMVLRRSRGGGAGAPLFRGGATAAQRMQHSAAARAHRLECLRSEIAAAHAGECPFAPTMATRGAACAPHPSRLRCCSSAAVLRHNRMPHSTTAPQPLA